MLGRFVLHEMLGEGGMGRVYKAWDPELKAWRAVKVIRGRVDEFALSRLRDEAATMAGLDHPNVLKVHDVQTAGGETFIVMEFAPGGTLAKKLNHAPQLPNKAAEMARVLARAVHHANDHGVIHRDLKPGNVLLGEGDTLKVADFGLAKQRKGSEDWSATRGGAGTPAYMAPEQTTGQSTLTPAADVYALGAILYEMLTGHPPFVAAEGSTNDLVAFLEQVRYEEPVPPSRVVRRIDRDLETICLKCLRKPPAGRYPSAAALADDLQRYLDREPIVARPVSRWERTARWVRRRPWQAALVATVAAGGVGGGALGLMWYEARQTSKATAAKAEAEADKMSAVQQAFQARLGVIDTAVHFADLARAIRTELANKNPNETRYRTGRANALRRLAELRLAAADRLPPADRGRAVDEAKVVATLDEARRDYEAVLEKSRADPEAAPGLGGAFALLASALADDPARTDDAREYLRKADRVLSGFARATDPNPEVLFALAGVRSLAVELGVPLDGADAKDLGLTELDAAVRGGYRGRHPDDVRDDRAFRKAKARERDRFEDALRPMAKPPAAGGSGA